MFTFSITHRENEVTEDSVVLMDSPEQWYVHGSSGYTYYKHSEFHNVASVVLSIVSEVSKFVISKKYLTGSVGCDVLIRKSHSLVILACELVFTALSCCI